jgi:hypothetical protein
MNVESVAVCHANAFHIASPMSYSIAKYHNLPEAARPAGVLEGSVGESTSESVMWIRCSKTIVHRAGVWMSRRGRQALFERGA